MRSDAAGTRFALCILLLLLLAAGAVCAWSAWLYQDRVWWLHFSPDARYLAVQSDRGMTIFEPGGAGRIARIHRGWRAAFDPESRRAAVATSNSVVIIDLARRERVREIPVEESSFADVAFSPDGDRLAILAPQMRRLTLFDVDTGAPVWSTDLHEGERGTLLFSPDGNLLCSGGSTHGERTCQVRFRSTATGEVVTTVEILRHAYIRNVTYVDEGRALVVVTGGWPNLVFDLSAGAEPKEMPDHPLAAITGHFELSRDERRAVVFEYKDSWTSAASIIDSEKGERLVIADPMYGLAWAARFHPERALLSIASSDGVVMIHDLASGRRSATFTGNRPLPSFLFERLLVGAGVAWLIAWSVIRVRTRGGGPRNMDWLLVPLGGAVAAGCILFLHWLPLTDPWKSPDPIRALALLMRVELAGLLILVIAAALSKSWWALLTAGVALSALFIMTAALLMAVVSSV